MIQLAEHLDNVLSKRAMEIHVANHCNLNCMGCSHFSPLSKYSVLEDSQYHKDLMSINPAIRSYFSEIRLLGGEPLLNNNIADIIKTTREAFEKAGIVLVTNGLRLLDMRKSFWDSCRWYGVSIGITKYPINLDYSAIERIVEDNHVDCIVYADRCGIGKFQKRPLSLLGLENSYTNYVHCNFIREWSCLQLVGTKLYCCPTCAYFHLFSGYFGLDIQCDDYLDLATIKDVEQIGMFLFSVKDFCKYCKLDKIEKVDWNKSNKRIEEWT